MSHPASPRFTYTPIRSMGPGHRGRMAEHLLALDPTDRYLRFGCLAGETQIRAYVQGVDFECDDVFGIYNQRLELLAVAHLAYASSPDCESCAEFGVSVLKRARGRGYGKRLFERAAIHVRNQGVDMLFIHALQERVAQTNYSLKAQARAFRHMLAAVQGIRSGAHHPRDPAHADGHRAT